MGDGVLVYFGYPQAHEDDAERAVRAGLELIAAVTALKAPVSLQTRVGIATGLVVARRSDRIRCRSGTSGCRRDAEHCGPSAKHCRAEHRRHRRKHSEAPRQSVRPKRPRPTRTEGHRWSFGSLGSLATIFNREPLRGFARKRSDRTCR